MVLYNHFTVFHKDECPSHGDLDVPMVVVGSDLIGVYEHHLPLSQSV